jgi:hypothetical protein
MPANDRLRLHEDQCPAPAFPEPLQHDPEQFVGSSKSRQRKLLFENTELLPKSQVFQEQVPARAKEPSKENNHELQQAQHETSFTCERVE